MTWRYRQAGDGNETAAQASQGQDIFTAEKKPTDGSRVSCPCPVGKGFNESKAQQPNQIESTRQCCSKNRDKPTAHKPSWRWTCTSTRRLLHNAVMSNHAKIAFSLDCQLRNHGAGSELG